MRAKTAPRSIPSLADATRRIIRAACRRGVNPRGQECREPAAWSGSVGLTISRNHGGVAVSQSILRRLEQFRAVRDRQVAVLPPAEFLGGTYRVGADGVESYILPERLALGTFDMYFIDGRRRWVYRPFVSFCRRPEWIDEAGDSDDSQDDYRGPLVSDNDADISDAPFDYPSSRVGDDSQLGRASKRRRCHRQGHRA